MQPSFEGEIVLFVSYVSIISVPIRNFKLTVVNQNVMPHFEKAFEIHTALKLMCLTVNN